MADQLECVVHGLTIRIDRTLCVGFGDCVREAGAAFALDDDDIAVFVVPEAVPRDQLIKACESCPVDALVVLARDGAQLVPM